MRSGYHAGPLQTSGEAHPRVSPAGAPIAACYGHVTTTSDPTCWNGGWSGLGCGSPGRSKPQFVHSTFDQAGSLAVGGLLSSVASIQSTSVGTPPVVSVYTLLLPHIVCREPVPM